MLSEELKKILRRQKYKLIGKEAAVKLCLWTKRSILNKGCCYKEQFYGISSHRCIQLTPCVSTCSHRCLFCWRAVDFTETEMQEFDEPNEIIKRGIEAQKELLSGYGGIPNRINKEKLKEAFSPLHAAISLSGEPSLYPKINELINEFHKRKMTTFLVSNGTFPQKLEKLNPTQLYVSLCAPNKKIYNKLHGPLIKNGWERLNESLELISNMKCRTALRLTLVKNHNLLLAKEYGKLIKKADPMFVECKAYMHVGFSIYRLPEEAMPSFKNIWEFAKKISRETGYVISDENKISRVVLLCRDKKVESEKYIKPMHSNTYTSGD